MGSGNGARRFREDCCPDGKLADRAQQPFAMPEGDTQFLEIIVPQSRQYRQVDRLLHEQGRVLIQADADQPLLDVTHIASAARWPKLPGCSWWEAYAPNRLEAKSLVMMVAMMLPSRKSGNRGQTTVSHRDNTDLRRC
ncbi:MAG TPA: hypothetical protein VK864_17940 [Longimicrobiales bacterium]|nr:hypothetical protein [Longimicrobiales bacterium]